MRFAKLLEEHLPDWHHFTFHSEGRMLGILQKLLVDERNSGVFGPSTESSFMNVNIQLHHCSYEHYKVIDQSSMWADLHAATLHFNAAGFESSLVHQESSPKLATVDYWIEYEPPLREIPLWRERRACRCT